MCRGALSDSELFGREALDDVALKVVTTVGCDVRGEGAHEEAAHGGDEHDGGAARPRGPP